MWGEVGSATKSRLSLTTGTHEVESRPPPVVPLLSVSCAYAYMHARTSWVWEVDTRGLEVQMRHSQKSTPTPPPLPENKQLDAKVNECKEKVRGWGHREMMYSIGHYEANCPV